MIYIYIVQTEICFQIDMEMIGFRPMSCHFKKDLLLYFISLSFYAMAKKAIIFLLYMCQAMKILCGISLFVSPINYLCERKFEYSFSKSKSLNYENLYFSSSRDV